MPKTTFFGMKLKNVPGFRSMQETATIATTTSTVIVTATTAKRFYFSCEYRRKKTDMLLVGMENKSTLTGGVCWPTATPMQYYDIDKEEESENTKGAYFYGQTHLTWLT